jgi:hypothetical protein
MTDYGYLGIGRSRDGEITINIAVGKNRKYVPVPISESDFLELISAGARMLAVDAKQRRVKP